MFARPRKLTRPVLATNVDDDEVPRFPDDTELSEGVEFFIVEGRHAWPPHPESELFYTIESRGTRYNVTARDLEPAMGD